MLHGFDASYRLRRYLADTYRVGLRHCYVTRLGDERVRMSVDQTMHFRMMLLRLIVEESVTNQT